MIHVPKRPSCAQALHTEKPVLKLPGGETLEGSYQQSLGTMMVFTQTLGTHGESHAHFKCMTQQVLSFDDDVNANVYR